MKDWIGNTITILPGSLIIFPHYYYGESEYNRINNLPNEYKDTNDEIDFERLCCGDYYRE